MAGKLPQFEVPVVLMVFNRPAMTRRVLEVLASVRPREMLVVADGPRAGHPEDQALCRQTRALFDNIDWACRIQTNFSDTNLGCKHRVASGLDWAFSKVPEAVILEDDCLPDPSFFPFCEELLTLYRNEPRVHMISGTNLLSGRRFGRDSYYFSRFYHVWGWASWDRAWKHYDIGMSQWPEMRKTDWIERYLPTAPMARLARYFFDETYFKDRFTTWDYQWVFSSWLQNAHSIIPAVNLVTNIGFGETGSHMQDASHRLAKLEVIPMEFPLRHPAKVAVLEEADRFEWATLYPGQHRKAHWLARLRGRVNRMLRS